MPALALSALIVVLGSGAVAYGAEFAIPGDPLYAIKVDVLEPLHERMIRTPEKRVAWQIQKVQRRLGEARTLAAAGHLSMIHRETIERRISEQVVALKDTMIPPPSIEMHVAAQEVLAVAFEHYEQSVASDRAPVALMRGNPNASAEPEADHLLKFVQERKAAARGEIKYALTMATSGTGSSAPLPEASAKMGLSLTATGAVKKERLRDSAQSSPSNDRRREAEDSEGRIRIQIPMLKPRDRESSLSVQRISSAGDSSSVVASQASSVSVHGEGETETEMDTDTDASAAIEDSTVPEHERKLLQRVEEKKELIERQLQGF